ncbi:MAG: MBL fold metallo-hydrolase [Anaerolineales bacterium]|nr:MBL fold metallo-hydrolase [Anaerolineales bacterium]
MKEPFTVKFWGVRGSHPVPGGQTVRYGGNTACVEVRLGERILILDAGTGIIPLGRELARRAAQAGQPPAVTLLLSHLHHDHIQGFPFFVPAYLPGARLQVFGPGTSPDGLARVLEANQSQPTFPVALAEMPADKEIRSLGAVGTLVLEERGARLAAAGEAVPPEAALVRIHRSHAHPGGVHIYRVEWGERSLVYATDTEGYVGGDRQLVEFARGGDLLIHDAQYAQAHYRGQMLGMPSTQGYGHSTPEMACEVAAAAGVGTLVLFHHEPSYADAAIAALEDHARARFPQTLAAFEGLELPVGGQVGRAARLDGAAGLREAAQL